MSRRNPPLLAFRPAAGLVVALALVGTACGEDGRDTTPAAASAPSATAAPAPAGRITVLAAASLTEAFTEVGEAFEADHPGTAVTFSFDASSTLAAQANSGAPADVYASADENNMRRVIDAGNAFDARTFARNELAIIVGRGNPEGIGGLADLERPGVIYVLCALQVPCGSYGRQALEQAGVTRSPASYEANVKGVVTKVATGQADAGIVYVTDAEAAAGKTDRVVIPPDLNVAAGYPVAVLDQAPNPEAARAFVDFVLSRKGQAILAEYGFLPAS